MATKALTTEFTEDTEKGREPGNNTEAADEVFPAGSFSSVLCALCDLCG